MSNSLPSTGAGTSCPSQHSAAPGTADATPTSQVVLAEAASPSVPTPHGEPQGASASGSTQPSVSPWEQKPRPWWPQLRQSRYLGGAGRVVGLDAARGIALLGMVVAHAGASDAFGNTPRWLGFAHGRASILFAMVAGISLAIITGGPTPRQGEYVLRDRLRIFTRAVVLLVLASLLESVGTPISIILGAYALWFVLALPFVRCSVRALLIWGLSLAALGSTVNFLVDEASYWFGFYPGASPGNGLLTMLFVSTYPAVVWMGFVLLGMAIGRSDLTRPRVLLGYGLSGLLLFTVFAAPFVARDGVSPLLRVTPATESAVPLDQYPVASASGSMNFKCMQDGEIYPCDAQEYEQLSSAWTAQDWDRYGELIDSAQLVPVEEDSVRQRYISQVFTLSPHSGSTFEALSSGGFAMAVIAGAVALGRRLRYLLAPLAAVGSMSLTAYTIHVVTTAALAGTDLAASNASLLCQVVGLSAFALVWAFFFQRGPLEQAMASWADRGSALPRQKAGRHARGAAE